MTLLTKGVMKGSGNKDFTQTAIFRAMEKMDFLILFLLIFQNQITTHGKADAPSPILSLKEGSL